MRGKLWSRERGRERMTSIKFKHNSCVLTIATKSRWRSNREKREISSAWFIQISHTRDLDWKWMQSHLLNNQKFPIKRSVSHTRRLAHKTADRRIFFFVLHAVYLSHIVPIEVRRVLFIKLLIANCVLWYWHQCLSTHLRQQQEQYKQRQQRYDKIDFTQIALWHSFSSFKAKYSSETFCDEMKCNYNKCFSFLTIYVGVSFSHSLSPVRFLSTQ